MSMAETKVAEQESQVVNQLGKLEEALESLRLGINNMGTRLENVRCSQTAKEATPRPDSPTDLCPLASTLASFTSSVNEMRDDLQDIQNTLEN